MPCALHWAVNSLKAFRYVSMCAVLTGLSAVSVSFEPEIFFLASSSTSCSALTAMAGSSVWGSGEKITLRAERTASSSPMDRPSRVTKYKCDSSILPLMRLACFCPRMVRVRGCVSSARTSLPNSRVSKQTPPSEERRTSRERVWSLRTRSMKLATAVSLSG